MGGVASNDAVRAVFAWGMLPSVFTVAGAATLVADIVVAAPLVEKQSRRFKR
jgi:hypothetical protein